MPDGLGTRSDDGLSRSNHALNPALTEYFPNLPAVKRMAQYRHHDVQQIADRNVSQRIARSFDELWRKLGDGLVRKVAYRGGWKPT